MNKYILPYIISTCTIYSKVWDSNKPIPTMNDFDKKLSETDAYLQILIDQVQVMIGSHS